MDQRFEDLEQKIADLKRIVKDQQMKIELLKEAIVTGKKNDYVS